MKKSILIRAGIGFLMGMAVGNIIAVLTTCSADGPVQFYSDFLLERTGSAAVAALLQTLLSGVYGAVSMAGTVTYEVEQWSLVRATLTHYLIIVLCYPPLALLLGWSSDVWEILIAIGIMTAVFFLIWLIMAAIYRRQVQKLNEMNRAQMEDLPSEEKEREQDRSVAPDRKKGE